MREGYIMCDVCGEEQYGPHRGACVGCKSALEDCGSDAAYLIEKLVKRIERLEKKISQ